MPSCHADPSTKYEEIAKSGKSVRGGFLAPTRIGFNAISFDYTSKVTYSHPKLPVNIHPNKENNFSKGLLWRVTTESDSSRIFNKFSSEWLIRANPEGSLNSCIVDYQIEMEFSNPLYSAVTSQFFDLLVANIDD